MPTSDNTPGYARATRQFCIFSLKAVETIKSVNLFQSHAPYDKLSSARGNMPFLYTNNISVQLFTCFFTFLPKNFGI